MKRAAALLACLCLAGTAGAQAQPRPEASVRSWLQQHLGPDNQDARYAAAFADLDGDSRPEAIVYLMSSNHCGTGGCVLFVLTPQAGSWRRIAYMTVTNPPVRLLTSRTRGWLDLGSRQRELRGRRFLHYEARLRFNGRTYPSNPSMPPAERLTRPVPGRELIFDDDPGRPVF